MEIMSPKGGSSGNLVTIYALVQAPKKISYFLLQ